MHRLYRLMRTDRMVVPDSVREPKALADVAHHLLHRCGGRWLSTATPALAAGSLLWSGTG